ncbi:MAG: ribosome assembly factor SBDS [Candidatus Poseidoniales archaeon]
MVSLDDAVLARYEHSGHRFELLVDPSMVELYRSSPDKVDLDEFLVLDEIFEDARGGERHTESTLLEVFGTLDIHIIVDKVMEKGSIQLTTQQRKEMVEQMRQKIIHSIHIQAVDPRSKSPHPKTRIELALEESRFSVDPFKRLDAQVKEAIAKLKPLLPLSFENSRMAVKVPPQAYGSVHQLLREYQQREEWLADGNWACVIECPAAIKAELIGQMMKKSSDIEVKELS